MANPTAPTPGLPLPLGATFDGGGTNFAVVVGNIDGDGGDPGGARVELCLFDDDGVETRFVLTERSGSTYHARVDVGPGTRYGYRVRGVRRDGDVWNSNKLLLDPYALAVVGEFTHDERLLDNDLDSAGATARSVVVDPTEFDWEGDRLPRIPWEESVIYEAHVKGLTQLHPGVAEELRGTYLGVSSPAVVDHLRSVGATAVELLPVHRHVSEPRLAEMGLSNYWGYNSIGFCAPHHGYAAGRDGVAAVSEFKEMVKRLHQAGIEVILDVVYNHTAEGGPGGPILSFRGLDNTSYYRSVPDSPGVYDDSTGCGNSVDARRPQVIALILDSLRYWVTEMHVDGFRFDLATTLARGDNGFDSEVSFLAAVAQDPVLSEVKLIAEPWDVGLGGYQVGQFPHPWSEWNGRYRDVVRDFWRGEPAMLGEMAQRICGSSDLYEWGGRSPRASLNFITAHDGFTLADLCSYERKHNEANGEDNRDGTDDNRSTNGGVEGPTDDIAVLERRARQRRSLVATLFLSQGVPMLLGGDELAATQHGTNNAYAQDNEISWLDWAGADLELLTFVQRLGSFRQAHPVVRRRRFLEGRPTGLSVRDDVSWFTSWGEPMGPEHWNDPDGRLIVMFLNGRAIAEPDRDGGHVVDDSLLIIVNGADDATSVTLPVGAWPTSWSIAIDTSVGALVAPASIRAGDHVSVEARTVMVFVATAAD